MAETDRKSLTIQISEIYFYLALTYYATRDTERNRERCREYINLWLEKNPNKTIDDLSYPKGFMEIFRQVRSGTQKPEVEIKPPTEKPEVKKDGQ